MSRFCLQTRCLMCPCKIIMLVYLFFNVFSYHNKLRNNFCRNLSALRTRIFLSIKSTRWTWNICWNFSLLWFSHFRVFRINCRFFLLSLQNFLGWLVVGIGNFYFKISVLVNWFHSIFVFQFNTVPIDVLNIFFYFSKISLWS